MSTFSIFGVFQMVLHKKSKMSLRRVFTDRGSYVLEYPKSTFSDSGYVAYQIVCSEE